MKVRIIEVLPESAHFENKEYSLVGTVGDLWEHSEDDNYVEIRNCVYPEQPGKDIGILVDGSSTYVYAKIEIVEE